MGASLTCGKWSEPPRSGYNTLFDQNLLCYEEGILYYYRSSTETITQTDVTFRLGRHIRLRRSFRCLCNLQVKFPSSIAKQYEPDNRDVTAPFTVKIKRHISPIERKEKLENIITIR